MLANITQSDIPPAQSRCQAKSRKGLGQLLLLAGVVAFILMPMGHGCGLTHKHPADDEDDGVAFRLQGSSLKSLGPQLLKETQNAGP